MTNEKLLHYIEIITSDLQGRYRVSKEKATEATYRAFANVWDKDYDPQAFFQYFRVAAKNELVHMFRHEKKYDFDREIDLTRELTCEQEDMENDPEKLDRISERLPDVYVELFGLLRQGIDHREIANRLNKSHGAIRVMKTRMIQYCQAALVVLLIGFTMPLQAQDTLDVSGKVIVGQDSSFFDLQFPREIATDTAIISVYDTTFVADTTFTTVYDTTFVVDSTFVTVCDTTQVVDSVYTLVKNEAPTLRNVWWQHRREAGQPYNYFDIRGESTADSLVFRWRGEEIKKKTIQPSGEFRVTVKTDYLGEAEYSITGYDSLWTITNKDIINTALMDTLGGQNSINMPLVAGVDAEFDARSGVTSSSGAVTSFAAVTGGWTLTVPSGESSPADNLATLNGVNAISMNGVDQALHTTEAGYDRGGSITSQFVIRPASQDSDFGYFIDGGGLNDNAAMFQADNTIDMRRGGTQFGGVPYAPDEWIVLTIIYDENGNERIYIDNSLLFDSPETEIGAAVGMYLGVRGGGGSGYGKFDVVHIVEYFGEALSDADVLSNVSFLQSEWGLGGGGTTSLSGSGRSNAFGSGLLTEKDSLSGADAALFGGAAASTSKQALSGAGRYQAGGSSNLLKNVSISGVSRSTASGDALLKQMAALAGRSVSNYQGSAEASSLQRLSGSTQSLYSGTGLLEQLGNLISLSGTSRSEAGGQASTLMKASLSGASASEYSGSAAAKVTIAVSGDMVTLVGGQAALDMAQTLAGRSVSTYRGAAQLSIVGELWIGDITLSEEELYKITLQAQPFYKITLTEQPLYNITLEIQ